MVARTLDPWRTTHGNTAPLCHTANAALGIHLANLSGIELAPLPAQGRLSGPPGVFIRFARLRDKKMPHSHLLYRGESRMYALDSAYDQVDCRRPHLATEVNGYEDLRKNGYSGPLSHIRDNFNPDSDEAKRLYGSLGLKALPAFEAALFKLTGFGLIVLGRADILGLLLSQFYNSNDAIPLTNGYSITLGTLTEVQGELAYLQETLIRFTRDKLTEKTLQLRYDHEPAARALKLI